MVFTVRVYNRNLVPLVLGAVSKSLLGGVINAIPSGSSGESACRVQGSGLQGFRFRFRV